MYEGSSLKADNDAELIGALKQGAAISHEAMSELASNCPTVTPFWWGIWVMLRLSPPLLPNSAQAGQPLPSFPLPSVLLSHVYSALSLSEHCQSQTIMQSCSGIWHICSQSPPL